MSDAIDHEHTVERLERRLAREKSARLQAEDIAERVASDHWQIRQELERKLTLRTAELEAARLAATSAITAGQRLRASLSHDVRTSLTALIVLAESLQPGVALNADDIARLRGLLSRLHDAVEAGYDAAYAETPETPETTLGDIVDMHREQWQQLAARSGKLLILDVDSACIAPPAVTAAAANERVVEVITRELRNPEPLIEVRLRVSVDGLDVT